MTTNPPPIFVDRDKAAELAGVSLRMEWWPTDNAAVNLLHDNLQDLLWWVPPEAAAQDELDGVPAVKKHRRVPTLQMPLKGPTLRDAIRAAMQGEGK